jgi:UDPglucose 6-dehydrogenase
MISITIIGTGYVGLVSGVCLADFGNTVTCVDIDAAKIKRLSNGDVPIYEPGLKDILRRNIAAGRLFFSSSLAESLENSEVVFVTVGTPPMDNGYADLSHVEAAVREIASCIRRCTVIVNKSTVPVGTGRKLISWVREELSRRIKDGDSTAEGLCFDVVSNPEFLREGAAVQDFTHPDRIVIGAETEKARNIMKEIYRPLYLNERPYIETSIETAEMIKYATNAFLAVKITFINEIANLCEAAGANVQEVANAMGRDGRIGRKFLHPGPGYGGSCFPKDTRALAHTGRDLGSPVSIVEAVISANENQKQRMVTKIETFFKKNGGMAGKRIAVLGLSYKPNTNDVRESPSLVIIRGLIQRGARIHASDPAAIPEASLQLADIKDSILFFNDEYEAISGCDALVIVTEWNQYRNLNLEKVKKLLKGPVFFDLRNVYKRQNQEQHGFTYFAVGA